MLEAEGAFGWGQGSRPQNPSQAAFPPLLPRALCPKGVCFQTSRASVQWGAQGLADLLE